uniref:Hypotheticial protein n=1 Tax=Schistosoma japonicum TaxID=6182 RepID=C1LD94_SCHJA|nr:hypotheticial protein [Schistosoma japonicum]
MTHSQLDGIVNRVNEMIRQMNNSNVCSSKNEVEKAISYVNKAMNVLENTFYPLVFFNE